MIDKNSKISANDLAKHNQSPDNSTTESQLCQPTITTETQNETYKSTDDDASEPEIGLTAQNRRPTLKLVFQLIHLDTGLHIYVASLDHKEQNPATVFDSFIIAFRNQKKVLSDSGNFFGNIFTSIEQQCQHKRTLRQRQ